MQRESPQYQKLTITGDISIEPVPPGTKVPNASRKYLIMGPTGAGKSSFIEAFAGESQSLRISKDQLDGYTQGVMAYRLVNAYQEYKGTCYPIYLIDSPGFLDTKISEVEIIEMVKYWLRLNRLEYFDRMFFMIPITDTRLGGSKRRTIEMIRALLIPDTTLYSITLITTMWDTIHSEQAQNRAASNFVQVKEEIFKDFIDKGARIFKFRNIRTSALAILGASDDPMTAFSRSEYLVYPHLYQDLHERIEAVLLQKAAIEVDLASADTAINPALQAIFEQNQKENTETLLKFVGQLSNMGQPPEGAERAAQGLRKRIAAEMGATNTQFQELFRTWAEESVILEDYSVHELESQPGESLEDRVPQPASVDTDASFEVGGDVHSPPRRDLALKGILRRIFNLGKRRGAKWAKRG